MSRIGVHTITKAASRVCYCSEAELTGGSKPKHLVRIRWAIALVAIEHGHSASHIGRTLGGRDHSTIGYGVEQANRLITKDRNFAFLVDSVAQEAENLFQAERPSPRVSAIGLGA